MVGPRCRAASSVSPASEATAEWNYRIEHRAPTSARIEASKENLGAPLVRAVMEAVPKAGGQIITDLDPRQGVQACAVKVQAALKAGNFAGVVLLGSYDVVPSARLDVLTPELRQAVAAVPDPDDFTVWSDAVYADTNNDTFAEWPVSRVPDAKSREVFLGALQAGTGSEPGKLCVHNVKRPFAKAVFAGVAGRGSALSSEPTTSNESRAQQSDMQGNIYLMLHGDDADGSAFWGEDVKTRQMVEAFNTNCVPARANCVAFSGACWGALTVTRRAAAQDPSRLPQSKGVENSIALSALKAGYRAFVGCTGAHYSPLKTKPTRRADRCTCISGVALRLTVRRRWPCSTPSVPTRRTFRRVTTRAMTR